jgi:hypothetical protein
VTTFDDFMFVIESGHVLRVVDLTATFSLELVVDCATKRAS